jgi:hypothetical protein
VTQQHRLAHRGCSFQFVSYEGKPADEAHQQPGIPPSWYLMLAGKRWMVGPQVVETTPAELDRQFGDWLEAHGCRGAPALQCQQPQPVDARPRG